MAKATKTAKTTESDVGTVPPLPETFDELQAQLTAGVEKYGHLKVTLVHADGSTEGIWAVPADAESAARYRTSNSRDEAVLVRLTNVPLGWNGLTWGGLVRARTQGERRPEAQLHDQAGLALDRERLRDLVAAELARREKEKEKK